MPARFLSRLTLAASLAVAATVAAPALPAYADDTTGSVVGHFLNGTAPMPGVGVALSPTDGSADSASTVTDQTGAFVLGDVAPGTYVVRFDVTDQVRQYYHHSSGGDPAAEVITVTAGGQTTVEETLYDFASLTGHVVTAAGAPLANATVIAEGTFGVSTTTDANGDYAIPYLWPGSYRVAIRDATGLEQYVPQAAAQGEGQEFSLAAGQHEVVNETQLPTGVLKGTVTKGGAIVPLAVVGVLWAGGSEMATTTTDASGSFEVPVFATQLQVRFKTYVASSPLISWYHRKPTQATSDVITVAVGETVTINEDVVDFGTLAGTLTTTKSAPVIGATVVAESGGFSQSATTDKSGRYSMTLPTGKYTVRFQAQGTTQWAYGKYSAAEASAFNVTAGKTTTVNDVLRPSGTLAVTAKDATTGASVTTFCVRVSGGAPTCTENGTASVAVLPGTVEFSVEATGYGTFTGTAQVQAGQVTAQEATLAPPVGVSITAVDPWTGQPVNSFCTTAARADTTQSACTETGTIVMDNLGTGDVTLTTDVGYGITGFLTTTTHVQVDAGQITPVAVELRHMAAIKVTATDTATGAKINNFCVIAQGPSSNAACTADGTALVTDLFAGTYSLQISANYEANYLDTNLTGVVATDDEIQPVAATLRKGTTLTVVAKDSATGAPVANECVRLVATDQPSDFDGPRLVGCTDAQGNLTAYGVQPDTTYNAFVIARDGVHGHQWVGPRGGVGAQAEAKVFTANSGGTIALKLAVDRAGTISGKVTDRGTGQPVNHAMVGITSSASVNPELPGPVFTDEQGNYTVANVGPYKWALFFRHEDYAAQWSGGVADRTAAQRVTVTAGATATYNMALVRGSTLTGVVSVPTGHALDQAYVWVINANTRDQVGLAFVGSDGRYTLRVLGKEKIKVQVVATVDGRMGAPVWYVAARDFAHATPLTMPQNGTLTANLTVPAS